MGRRSWSYPRSILSESPSAKSNLGQSRASDEMIVSAALANFVSGQNDFTRSPVSKKPDVSLKIATRVPEGAESGALQKRHNADWAKAQTPVEYQQGRWFASDPKEGGPIEHPVAKWDRAARAAMSAAFCA